MRKFFCHIIKLNNFLVNLVKELGSFVITKIDYYKGSRGIVSKRIPLLPFSV
ncbi:hypothetical protein [Clostridium sp.]|uniref:hypothetical protein n=1 Tax=Clostridium sp. TaxID=1506 RepID=UPI003463C2F1